MKTIKFPEHTGDIAKDQDEYNTLPVHRFKDDPQGCIVCCWKLSFWEKVKVLFTGCIWHEILTFNQSLQPQRLSVDKPVMEKHNG